MKDDPERPGVWIPKGRAESARTRVPVATRRFDANTGAELTTDIVLTIADARDVDPEELRSPQLYDVVDIGALEGLFVGHGAPSIDEGHPVRLEFTYAEFTIGVENDGWITVYE